MPREPIACDDAEAQRYLGCSDFKWAELKRRRIVKPLCRGWFAWMERFWERVSNATESQIRLA